MKRSLLLSVSSLLLAMLLGVSLCLPWFHLPILGWTVPAPAWNRAGLVCFALSGLLVIRAVAGWPFRWPVRIATPIALYYWWASLEAVKTWGAKNLAPAQLKLAAVNQTLSRLGGESVTVYEPALWRSLEPQHGWHLAGLSLFLIGLLSVLDGPRSLLCSACQTKAKESDHFCHCCGHTLTISPGCRNCGGKPHPQDTFCRHCGSKFEDRARENEIAPCPFID